MTAPLPMRPARPEELEALAALVHEAYRGRGAGWTTEADVVGGLRTTPQELAAVLGREDLLLLVAEDEDGLLACCQLEDRGAGLAHFGTFAVRPTTQGGGTGRRVLATAAELAVERFGAHTLELSVLEVRTELIAWYERQGFERTGERRPFPWPEKLKVPGLGFVVLARPL